MDEDIKRCSKCKTFSPKFNFYKDNTKIDGYRPDSKYCTKQYRYENREKRNIYFENRRKLDLKFKLICNTRRRIHRALKGKSKPSSTLDILGNDIETYKKWIEWQMTPEMIWRNIELDHVKPICMFDISYDEQLKEAFNWRNTQPLIKEIHQKKGIKYNFLIIDCSSSSLTNF